MWHDNETSKDFIGFRRYANTISTLILTEKIQPSTIGLYGDWGSGKSSVLKMIEDNVTTHNNVCVIRFDGWQFEGYDDAKAALMTTIIDSIPITESIKDKLATVIKRIDWFRVAGLITKGVIKLSLPGFGILQAGDVACDTIDGLKSIKESFDNKSRELTDIFKSIREFRQEFNDLIESSKIETLVVLIDDLDRCLPDTIISTLEAIRLFLSINRTVFVIAADEDIVKNAVNHRFPSANSTENKIATNYLEKLVQIPVKIPPMDRSETERYILLLLLSKVLSETQVIDLLDSIEKERKDPTKQFNITMKSVQDLVGIKPNIISEPFEIGCAISSVLASRYTGNPRQIKRFLNDLSMRQLVATHEEIEMDNTVLAKLMLLEQFHTELFQELYQWQEKQNGNPLELSVIENLVSQNTNLPDLYKNWSKPDILSWLQSTPCLTGKDLSPYFYLSREMLHMDYSTGKSFSKEQRDLLGLLISGSGSMRKNAETKMKNLSEESLQPIYEEMVSRLKKKPSDDKIFEGIVSIARVNQSLGSQAVIDEDINLALDLSTSRRITLFAGISNSNPQLKTDVIGCLTKLKQRHTGTKKETQINQVINTLNGV